MREVGGAGGVIGCARTPEEMRGKVTQVRAKVTDAFQTRAPGRDIVEHEGGGWYPTLDWVGVRAYDAAGVADSSSAVRSTWRTSYASMTSPSLTSSKPSRWMPHSKPSVTSRTSSLNRFSESIVVS